MEENSYVVLENLSFPVRNVPFAYLLLILILSPPRPYLLARSVGAWRRSGGAGRWLRERLLSRVYHYVFTLGCILHWRGGWGLFDMLVETALPDANDVHRLVVVVLSVLAEPSTCTYYVYVVVVIAVL